MVQERKRRHITRTGGKVFIPLSRMRRIKREEDVLRAQYNREGKLKGKDLSIQHWHCPCGSIECLGNPSHRRS